MNSDIFHRPEVQRALRRLVSAKDPVELSVAKQFLGEDLFGTRVIVSLPVLEKETYLPQLSIFPLLSTDHIVSYFVHPYLYFISHDRLELPGIKVDYTVSFDTNYASYVRKIVDNQSLNGLDKSVISTLDQLLRRDADFNLFFYFIENFKLANPIVTALQTQAKISPQVFWQLLDERFRENMVALQKFKEIDCRRYVETGQLYFNIDPGKAYQNSIEFAYNLYAGEGRALVNMFLELHSVILLQLLGMFRIQHSSKKSAKYKLSAFMEFVQDKGVMFLERELVVIYKYFKDRNSVPILYRVNMGGNQTNLFEKIDNLAWDMTAPRFLERMLQLQTADFTIPLFLSSDKALLEYIKLFPVKATVFHRPSQNVISMPEISTEDYFQEQGCLDIVKPYYSIEKMSDRFSRIDQECELLLEKINTEYQGLLSTLSGA